MLNIVVFYFKIKKIKVCFYISVECDNNVFNNISFVIQSVIGVGVKSFLKLIIMSKCKYRIIHIVHFFDN